MNTNFIYMYVTGDRVTTETTVAHYQSLVLLSDAHVVKIFSFFFFLFYFSEVLLHLSLWVILTFQKQSSGL